MIDALSQISLRFGLYFEKKRVLLLRKESPFDQPPIKGDEVQGNIGKESWATKGAKFN